MAVGRGRIILVKEIGLHCNCMSRLLAKLGKTVQDDVVPSVDYGSTKLEARVKMIRVVGLHSTQASHRSRKRKAEEVSHSSGEVEILQREGVAVGNGEEPRIGALARRTV